MPNGTPETISLDALREQAPIAVGATPGQAVPGVAEAAPDIQAAFGSAATGATTGAAATGYNAQTGEIDPTTMTAAGQMTAITGRDSPLMRRAAQEGLLQAGRRGLQNSSFAAGAAMGSMVDRAAPLAAQDAATYFQNMRANIDAMNRAQEVSTGRVTDVSLFNARAANDMAALNAQLETAVSQNNADAVNRINQQMAELRTQVGLANLDAQTRTSMLNAEMSTQTALATAADQNRMNLVTMQANAELNRQFLAGTQAMDLAAIQGRYQQLISSNNAAASIYNSYMTSIGQAMANHDVTPDRIAQYINVMAQQMEGSLEMIDAMNALDLGPVEVPGAIGTGTGGESRVSPGVEVPPPTTEPAPAPAPPPSPYTPTIPGYSGTLTP